VIEDFVVQGGDPYSKGGEHAKGPVGSGGPGYTIPDELVGNPHKHVEGALSMAHAGPNTGGSQFFIVLSEASTRHLNGKHTVFGKVTSGMDVVKQIKQNDVINSLRVE
jgi:peptidyl-prolyl cis-trans isomerase B (cyclophilin B)